MRLRAPVAIMMLAYGGAGHAAECETIKPETRNALQLIMAGVYQVPGGGATCAEDLEIARQAIYGDGAMTLPCLTEVFRKGPGPAGVWAYEGPAPPDGHWVVKLIQRIDVSAAVGLYREWRGEEGTDYLTRIYVDAELARLGDGEFLPELVAFLMKPAEPPGPAHDRVRSLQEQAIEAISIRNYQPALTILEKLRSGAGPRYAKSWPWLPVYVAQLSGDKSALVGYAEDPERVSWALQALKRMGREDVLKNLAADSKYRYRESAQKLLDGT